MKIKQVEKDPVTRLVEALRKLPGVGPKSAQRMAMHILRSPREYSDGLAELIREVGHCTAFCSRCGNISATDPCSICSDSGRDAKALCVVEEPADVTSLEKTGAFRGLYHVLHGALSPLDGKGPEDIKLETLFERVKKEGTREVVIATNFDAEGEATARYLAKRFKSAKVRVTRIARGVPVGGDLQYIDEATLAEAISGRREMTPGKNNKH